MTRRAKAPGLALVGLCVAFTALFLALGGWQLQRRAWKLELIAQVDQRIHAAPSPAPGPGDWKSLSPTSAAYRRVSVTGVLDHRGETLTQAVTDLGPGFWVMTPLRGAEGFTVLVNRGFVPAARRDPAQRPLGRLVGPVTITGLLRFSEPGGGFLRANRPDEGRWYSRDIAAIAKARGLGVTAPYFIDADNTPNPGGWPRGGLTVVRFANSHLIYALTWFSLAAFCGGAGVFVLRDARRNRDEGAA
ncbi:SURF1 family protein [Caulobacter vibrioides]|uniref:SURF1-like protein n=1 Tax=Caulobacter vibrioides TaxID=155892 RepID=A0A290MK74_CAUVI|nr:SURF1 family protein [Caulobacter vibrioides]ATC32194.1 SURF1 family protein [Caulobacter vibrioides]